MIVNKVISAEKAVRLIKDKSFVVIEGSGGGVLEPSLLLKKLGERFKAEGAPKDITICHSTGIGDQKESGTDYIAFPGLVKRDIGGHFGMAPKMAELIMENKMEAYNFPQGVLSQMFTAIAGKKPGVITKVGLHTYIDPRLEGGKVNEITKADLVKVINIDGEEWLYFPRFKVDVALIRGTTADLKGNVTFEEEGFFMEAISIAQAAKNCGGIVIVQVKYLAKEGTLDPQLVKIPGIYVDYIVVDKDQKQTCLEEYNPSYCGRIKIPLEQVESLPPGPKRVISRRAAKELFTGAIVNLGFGMPDGIAVVAAEEGLLDNFTLTVEHGPIGGRPAGGVIFGVSYNPEVIIGQENQFNFYDGGGLDISFLGMGEVDKLGNVNTSKLGKRLTGCGGFINISQNAKKVVFCGTFTAKGLKCKVENGELIIINEGRIIKFVDRVQQITFNGNYSLSNKQRVLYITERAVFELTNEGIVLKEIAPGVDLQKDILGRMGFIPIISPDIKEMDSKFFK